VKRAQKKIDADLKAMEDWLTSIGSRKNSSDGMYPWVLDTPFGMLGIHPSPDTHQAREGYYSWLYCRWDNPVKGMPGQDSYYVNGKWNHALDSRQPIQDELERLERYFRVFKVIPTKEAA
jgi:hypothetical protein